MTIEELIARFESLKTEIKNAFENHPLEAIRSSCKIQVDRIDRSIRDLKAYPYSE